MRIDGKSPLSPTASGAGRATRAGGAGFSVAGGASAPRAGSAGALTAPASLDAMLAMQAADAVDEREARRRRGVARGQALLDALDGLKAGLLAGRIAPSDLARLTTALAQARETSGDPGLDDLLAQIDLRAQVEFAKLEQAKLKRI